MLAQPPARVAEAGGLALAVATGRRRRPARERRQIGWFDSRWAAIPATGPHTGLRICGCRRLSPDGPGSSIGTLDGPRSDDRGDGDREGDYDVQERIKDPVHGTGLGDTAGDLATGGAGAGRRGAAGRRAGLREPADGRGSADRSAL